jgi:hypothetical protein
MGGTLPGETLGLQDREDSFQVTCPYCGETVELFLEGPGLAYVQRHDTAWVCRRVGSRVGGFEALHFSFTSSKRLMRILCAIVGAQPLLMKSREALRAF